MDDRRLNEGSFRAMGSACRIVTDLDADAIDRSVHRLEDLEARWSRFRPDSEISELNRRAGTWVELSAITIDLVDRAEAARHATAGRFDPLMLDELVRLGYDRSHDLLTPADASIGAPEPRRRPDVGPILVERGAARIPAGSAFDPGGVGKGLAADLIAEDLLDGGAEWVVVSLGGDIRLGGRLLDELGTEVHLEHPHRRGVPWAVTTLHGGAIATSTTLVRRWTHDGATHHHLLDPSTAAPATGPRVAATVWADRGWWADVVAKIVVIDESVDADRLSEWNVLGIAYLADGDVEWLGATEHEVCEVVS